MKYILFIILCSLSTYFMDMSSDPGDYAALWKEVEAQKQKFPKKAVAIVDQIYTKAKKEKREDQLIKAIIYKNELSSSYEDNDPSVGLLRMEAEYDKLHSGSGKAVFASMLGEAYYKYGIQNMHRYVERTTITQPTEPLPFSSIEEIQKQSYTYYRRSLDIALDKDLSAFQILLEENPDVQSLRASTMEELLSFRALNHYMNSSSLVSIPTDGYALDQAALFDSSFRDESVSDKPADMKANALALFWQTAAIRTLSDEQRIILELYRLEYLNNNAIVENKQVLYESALEKLIAENKGKQGVEAAYAKFISYYLDQGQSYKAQFKPELKNAFSKAKNLIEQVESLSINEAYRSVIAAQRSVLEHVDFQLQVEKVVTPNHAFLAQVKYRNSSVLKCKVYKLSDRDYEQYTKENRYDSRIRFILGLPVSAEKEIKLAPAADHNFHATEFSLDGLQAGKYIIALIHEKTHQQAKDKGVSFSMFHVSKLSYISGSRTVSDSYVVDRMTGEPLEKVTVEQYAQSYNHGSRTNVWHLLDTKISSASGAFRFAAVGKSFKYKLIHGNDELDIGDYHYSAREHTPDRSTETYLFTDRAIYRPGQIVHFQGLVLSRTANNLPEVSPAANVDLVFRDGNRQVIQALDFRTNDYGTFHGTITLPEDGLTGRVSLEMKAGGRTFRHQIQVEEYKRPKIQASFDPLNNSYSLGDRIAVSGLLESYSGLKVPNAQVRYRVTKSEVRWFYGCYYPSFNGRANQEVGFGNTTTDSDGQFTIEFPTKKGAVTNRSFNYKVQVDITDSAGQSVTATKEVLVSEQPFHLSVDIPTRGYVDDIDSISIAALNNEGKEIEVQYDILVTDLSEPTALKRKRMWQQLDHQLMDRSQFNLLFPIDEYDGEMDPANWPENRTVVDKERLSQSEVKEYISRLDQGSYRIELMAINTRSQTVSHTSYLSVSKKGKKASPTAVLWHSEVPTELVPGEKLIIDLSTAYNQVKLLYKISKDNKVLSENWMELDPAATLTFPITEAHRGGITLELIIVKDGRSYTERRPIAIPWTNKDLKLAVSSFRDKIEPGSQEEWNISILTTDGKPVSGELLATMYDLSLEQFKKHKWQKTFYPISGNYETMATYGFGLANHYSHMKRYNPYQLNVYGFQPRLRSLDLGHNNRFGYMNKRGRAAGVESEMMMDQVMPQSAPAGGRAAGQLDAVTISEDENGPTAEFIETAEFAIRENLHETVFFYPQMKITNGQSVLSFKMNEALTKWRLLLFAHTKDLQYSFNSYDLITQKKIMVEPHLPRFVRQGDKITVTASVSNMSEIQQEITSRIEILDLVSGLPIDGILSHTTPISQTLALGETVTVNWVLDIPEEQTTPLIVRVLSEGGSYSDGEQNIIPVMTNRLLVTETKPLHLKPSSTETYEFHAMEKMTKSKTLTNHKFVMEFTSDPSWLVAKAIPSLTEGDRESTLGLFHAYYGTLIIRNLLQQRPTLRQAIKNWKSSDLESPLKKNEELKNSELNNTPWVQAALAEEDQMSKLILYTDENHVSARLRSLKHKLIQRQTSNGGFSWRTGGRDNWYITQNILEGLAQLASLDIDDELDSAIAERAIEYVDEQAIAVYKRTDKKQKHLEPRVIQYLYVRSHFSHIPGIGESKKVVSYYFDKTTEYWPSMNSYLQGMLAIAAERSDRRALSEEIVASLSERMIRDEELGYYWNDQAGYYWYNLNVEKQALMIDVFENLADSRVDADGLRLLLLKHKQTNSWKTSKGTIAACYAYLKYNRAPTEIKPIFASMINDYDKPINFEQGSSDLSYQKNEWTAGDFDKNNRFVRISNSNDHVCWGAMYWQYYEDLDKIEDFEETPMQLSKAIYKVRNTNQGEELVAIGTGEKVTPGDRLRIRLNLQVDRPMEFIELSDMRSSGLEPLNVISSYKYQNGLGYYESTKDLASYFYFDFIPKGNFVFEYDVFAAHRGTFSNGIARIQSVYAPEFSSHSEGVAIQITNP